MLQIAVCEIFRYTELWMFYMPNNQVLSAIPNKRLAYLSVRMCPNESP